MPSQLYNRQALDVQENVGDPGQENGRGQEAAGTADGRGGRPLGRQTPAEGPARDVVEVGIDVPGTDPGQPLWRVQPLRAADARRPGTDPRWTESGPGRPAPARSSALQVNTDCTN